MKRVLLLSMVKNRQVFHRHRRQNEKVSIMILLFVALDALSKPNKQLDIEALGFGLMFLIVN